MHVEGGFGIFGSASIADVFVEVKKLKTNYTISLNNCSSSYAISIHWSLYIKCSPRIILQQKIEHM